MNISFDFHGSAKVIDADFGSTPEKIAEVIHDIVMEYIGADLDITVTNYKELN